MCRSRARGRARGRQEETVGTSATIATRATDTTGAIVIAAIHETSAIATAAAETTTTRATTMRTEATTRRAIDDTTIDRIAAAGAQCNLWALTERYLKTYTCTRTEFTIFTFILSICSNLNSGIKFLVFYKRNKLRTKTILRWYLFLFRNTYDRDMSPYSENASAHFGHRVCYQKLLHLNCIILVHIPIYRRA